MAASAAEFAGVTGEDRRAPANFPRRRPHRQTLPHSIKAKVVSRASRKSTPTASRDGPPGTLPEAQQLLISSKSLRWLVPLLVLNSGIFLALASPSNIPARRALPFDSAQDRRDARSALRRAQDKLAPQERD